MEAESVGDTTQEMGVKLGALRGEQIDILFADSSDSYVGHFLEQHNVSLHLPPASSIQPDREETSQESRYRAVRCKRFIRWRSLTSKPFVLRAQATLDKRLQKRKCKHTVSGKG